MVEMQCSRSLPERPRLLEGVYTLDESPGMRSASPVETACCLALPLD